MRVATDIINDPWMADRQRLRRLEREHGALEARIKDLHVRAQGQWHDLDEVWADFTRDLEAHMTFEERELFELFLSEHPEQSDYVADLLVEHGQIRRAVERLGMEIQLHVVRAHTVDALLAALRQHSASEHRVFYPWLEDKLT